MAKNVQKDVVIVVPNDKKQPPTDDCCPICFDSFKIPCRTNCGHWYCGGCFLQLWRHTKNVKWCKCPMCGCAVKKISPYSSKLTTPEEDKQKILRDIRGYNYQNVRGWFAWFMRVRVSARRWLEAFDIKALFAFFLALIFPIRRAPPEDGMLRKAMLFLSIYTPFHLIVGLAYQLSYSGYAPRCLADIATYMLLFSPAIWLLLIFFFVCDEIWFRRRRRARHLGHAQAVHFD